jgi:hypothetical protein
MRLGFAFDIVEPSWDSPAHPAIIPAVRGLDNLSRIGALGEAYNDSVARMHSVELLEEAIALAHRLGFQIRQEWVGTGGGACEFRGQRWLFIDLSQTVVDQLDCVREAIASCPQWQSGAISPQLDRLLRRAA